jgi:hypothetical protein
MDLAVLGSTVFFIPTPGQTEQIYLAEFYYNYGKAYFKNQENLNLKYNIEKALVYSGFKGNCFKSDLSSVVDDMKKK